MRFHSDDGAFGIRVVDAKQLTAEDIREVCSKAMSCLTRTTDENGKFQYIYYPGTDEVPEDYNLATLTEEGFALYRIEMAMACYETYQRMVERGIKIDYDVNLGALKALIRKCAENEMIGCLWPEYAMSMAKSAAAEGAFFRRDEIGLYVENDNTLHAVVGLIKYSSYIEDFV